MRICHICPSFNNNIYSQLTERQLRINEKIRVFYYRAKGTGLPNGEKEYVDGVLPYKNIDRLFYYVKEKKILKAFLEKYKSEEYELYHAHTLFSAGYIALEAKKRWGTPYIVAVRGTDINVFFKYRFFLRKLGRKIIEEAESVIFISHAHKDEVLKRYIHPEKKVTIEQKTHVIPNGIDEFWHQNKGENNVGKDKKFLSLIYYGDIDRNKNIETTIKAIDILIKRGYEIEFHVIGKIKDKKYEKLINAKEFVQYHDFVPKEELVYYVRNAHIFIMPSKSETFGLAYVEAMSQGVPVIYSKGQGFDKQFDEGQVGYHVKTNSSKEIACAIEKIIENYSYISGNCLKYSEHFRWDKIVLEYQSIYRKTIKEKYQDIC